MGNSHRTLPLFFIIGSQRSGTTMFRLMLNQHPELAVPFECGFITIFYRSLVQYGDLTSQENVRRLLGDIAEFSLVRKARFMSLTLEGRCRRTEKCMRKVAAVEAHNDKPLRHKLCWKVHRASEYQHAAAADTPFTPTAIFSVSTSADSRRSFQPSGWRR